VFYVIYSFQRKLPKYCAIDVARKSVTVFGIGLSGEETRGRREREREREREKGDSVDLPARLSNEEYERGDRRRY